VLLEVNASFLLILFNWDVELLERVQIHDTGSGTQWPPRSLDLTPLDLFLWGFGNYNYRRLNIVCSATL
jgi:hypothetical protein